MSRQKYTCENVQTSGDNCTNMCEQKKKNLKSAQNMFRKMNDD